MKKLFVLTSILSLLAAITPVLAVTDVEFTYTGMYGGISVDSYYQVDDNTDAWFGVYIEYADMYMGEYTGASDGDAYVQEHTTTATGVEGDVEHGVGVGEDTDGGHIGTLYVIGAETFWDGVVILDTTLTSSQEESVTGSIDSSMLATGDGISYGGWFYQWEDSETLADITWEGESWGFATVVFTADWVY